MPSLPHIVHATQVRRRDSHASVPRVSRRQDNPTASPALHELSGVSPLRPSSPSARPLTTRGTPQDAASPSMATQVTAHDVAALFGDAHRAQLAATRMHAVKERVLVPQSPEGTPRERLFRLFQVRETRVLSWVMACLCVFVRLHGKDCACVVFVRRVHVYGCARAYAHMCL